MILKKEISSLELPGLFGYCDLSGHVVHKFKCTNSSWWILSFWVLLVFVSANTSEKHVFRRAHIHVVWGVPACAEMLTNQQLNNYSTLFNNEIGNLH